MNYPYRFWILNGRRADLVVELFGTTHFDLDFLFGV